MNIFLCGVLKFQIKRMRPHERKKPQKTIITHETLTFDCEHHVTEEDVVKEEVIVMVKVV